MCFGKWHEISGLKTNYRVSMDALFRYSYGTPHIHLSGVGSCRAAILRDSGSHTPLKQGGREFWFFSARSTLQGCCEDNGGRKAAV